MSVTSVVVLRVPAVPPRVLDRDVLLGPRTRSTYTYGLADVSIASRADLVFSSLGAVRCLDALSDDEIFYLFVILPTQLWPSVDTQFAIGRSRTLTNEHDRDRQRAQHNFYLRPVCLLVFSSSIPERWRLPRHWRW